MTIPSTRERIALSSAVALSEHAAFEFHVGAWAGALAAHVLWHIRRRMQPQP